MGPAFQNCGGESEDPAVPQPDYAALGWKHGALTVQRFAAMLGPVTFVLPSGRSVSPLFVPPWVGKPSTAGVPGVIDHLRGEWPCVPFGTRPEPRGFTAPWAVALDAAGAFDVRGAPAVPDASADRGPLHGHGSNTPWRFTAVCATALELACRYPPDDDVHSLVRRIRVVEDAPAVELSLTVRVRRPTRIPIGLHFTFGNIADRVRILPGKLAAGRTYPGPLPARQAFDRDRAFSTLSSVPAAGGGELDATLFPFDEPNEDLLQLNGVEGSCSLDYLREAYRVTLSWSSAHFPSLHLWLSNRAIRSPPLSGETLALGLEPVCSAFGLGKGVSSGSNPFASSGTPTAIDIGPDHPFETAYRISADELVSVRSPC